MNHGKPSSLHLVEVNLISAQDLKPERKAQNMQTYVIAWIDPKRKLTSRIDNMGRENPTWNDKFVFMVDDEALNDFTAAMVFEIYCVRCFRKDKLVGTARVLLDNFFGNSNRYGEGMQGTFRAFQVRRPSGTPQGILNIGFIILDGLAYQVMNEILQMSSAVDHKKLIGGAKKDVKKMLCLEEMGLFCGLGPAKNGSQRKKIHQFPQLV